MKFEIMERHSTQGRIYELPEALIVTVLCRKELEVRICFHWNKAVYPCRSGIDIDAMSLGIFDLKSGTFHVASGVSAEDAEEFEKWYKSFC